MVGKATHAIVLVGISAKGHHDIAPSIVLWCCVHSGTTTATCVGRRRIQATKAAQHVHIIEHGVGSDSGLRAIAINGRIELLQKAGNRTAIGLGEVDALVDFLPSLSVSTLVAQISSVLLQSLSEAGSALVISILLITFFMFKGESGTGNQGLSEFVAEVGSAI